MRTTIGFNAASQQVSYALHAAKRQIKRALGDRLFLPQQNQVFEVVVESLFNPLVDFS